MDIKEIINWNAKKMFATTTKDIDLWHWSSKTLIDKIKRILVSGGSFCHFNRGAIGRGLYVSTSAVDLIEKGTEVMHFRLKKETKALVIHPWVFPIGMPEFFEISIEKLQWTDFKLPEAEFRLGLKDDINQIIDKMLDELNPDCCFYCYGYNLACLIRNSACVDFDEKDNAIQSVIEYHKNNPNDIPMLAPHLLKAWLEKYGG